MEGRRQIVLACRPAAEQAFRRALEIREKLAADLPTLPNCRQELARSHNSLGALLADLGQRTDAERAYRRALEIQEKLAADFATVPGYREYRRDLATSHNNLGNLLAALGQHEEAEAAYRAALKIQEQLAAVP